GGITNQLAITNDLYMAGLGTVQEPDSGIRAGTANIIASKITLIGDSGIGGGATNGPAVLMGPISGPFNMYFGNQGNAGGGGTGLILSNQCNWTGNTYLMGRIGTAASATRIALDENNALPNGFGYGSLYIGISGDNGNDLAFDLNGFNQTINGLFSASAGSQNHDIICNSSNATVSTLTIGNNDQSGLWGGLIVNNSFFPTTASGPTTAIMAITKIGAGVETFTNVNTYSGNTTISNGVLQLTGAGSINASTNINIDGGTFDVSALSYVIPAIQNINVSGGTFLINTATSGGGPANFTNGTLKVSSLSTVTANLTVPTLNIGGANNFIQPANIPPVPLYPIVFPIIKYTTLNGSAST
ncbi:MAG TPA: autotransporter-associated beta strand repeat-containing protein, partial [Phycisphaerae bacterium]|nr:autotransporter-associated beta strand repeat-containing protein [Phycisphaerae bacterium]